MPRGPATGHFACPGGGTYAEQVTDRPAPAREFGPGLGFAIAAYGLWGFLPVYFVLLTPVGPFEIVAFRILLALVFCAILLTVTRAWKPFLALARQPRVLGIMALAGVLHLRQLAGVHLRDAHRRTSSRARSATSSTRS